MKLGRWITRTRLVSKPPFILNAQALYERAQASLECGDWALAVEGFLKASEIVRSWADPCRQLGELAVRLRQPDEAVMWFVEGLRRSPEDIRLHHSYLAALLLSDPAHCERLLDVSQGKLPVVPIGHDAVWRKKLTTAFPQPRLHPASGCHEQIPRGIEIGAVVRTLEVFTRSWSYDNDRDGVRTVQEAIHQWRMQIADERGSHRLQLDPEWISNIGQLAFMGVIAKFGRLGLLQDHSPLLPPVASGPAANMAMLEYWSDLFTSPPLAQPSANALEPMVQVCNYLKLTDGRSLLLYEEAAPLAEQLWAQHGLPPILQTRAEHLSRGRECLEQLGVPKEAWFVTMHVRDQGFYGKGCDPGRCADILTYLPSVRMIHEQGGWVVRIGDVGMKPLPACPGLVDYPHSAHKSPWMDVFLMSQCRFFIGTNSGPAFVPPLFGVPCLYTNWFPFSLCPFIAGNLLIPKLYWNESEHRHLTFAEMIQMPLWLSFHLKSLKRRGLALQDNTPEEIQAAVTQMLQKVQGTSLVNQDDELRQKRLADIASAYPWAWSLRLGKDFLEAHELLLEAPPTRGASA
ncbi:MAG: TIGR04372 family glycosyltransferase [Verrucomicrobiaceae bacterium]|nr:TIGR04372 family glycosyltransferase [Verrucomicrobiaceae bacterium]